MESHRSDQLRLNGYPSEIFFSILYRRLLKHGILTSEDDLAQMLAYIETHNQTAKPFQWTYTGKVLEA